MIQEGEEKTQPASQQDNIDDVIQILIEVETLIRSRAPDGKDVHEFLQIVANIRAGIQLIKELGWNEERKERVAREIKRLKIFVATGVVPEEEIATTTNLEEL